MIRVQDDWDLTRTAHFITQNSYQRVALQFCDSDLPASISVANQLQSLLAESSNAKVFILADTSYNSESVDEVAAQHINADCVVHYGRASLTPVTRLPAFFVFPKQAVDVDAAAGAVVACQQLAVEHQKRAVLVMFDQLLEHAMPQLQAAVLAQQQGLHEGRQEGLQPQAEVPTVFAHVAARHLEPAGSPSPPSACCSSSDKAAVPANTTSTPATLQPAAQMLPAASRLTVCESPPCKRPPPLAPAAEHVELVEGSSLAVRDAGLADMTGNVAAAAAVAASVAANDHAEVARDPLCLATAAAAAAAADTHVAGATSTSTPSNAPSAGAAAAAGSAGADNMTATASTSPALGHSSGTGESAAPGMSSRSADSTTDSQPASGGLTSQLEAGSDVVSRATAQGQAVASVINAAGAGLPGPAVQGVELASCGRACACDAPNEATQQVAAAAATDAGSGDCGRMCPCDDSGGPTQPVGAAAAGMGSGEIEDVVAGREAAAAGGGSAGASTSERPPIGGLRWTLPPGMTEQDCLLLWLGPPDTSALTHLQLTYSRCDWVSWDSATGAMQHGLTDTLSRTLKRRNYMVERARAANIVGLLVGTLGAAGYLEALQRLRQLAKQAGKKTYTMLMGKPSPAKLANFPEVEVWVMVADPQGAILDSRGFLAPIVTPYEAWLAFTGRDLDPADYQLGFEALLRGEEAATTAGAPTSEERLAITVHPAWQLTAASGGNRGVVVKTGADYLAHKRTYKGLEMPATGGGRKEPSLALPGRSGRAAGYADELALPRP